MLDYVVPLAFVSVLLAVYYNWKVLKERRKSKRAFATKGGTED
jgi:hypothetical protein